MSKGNKAIYKEITMAKGTVNKVTLIGNVGDSPEINTLPSGDKVANVRLATNEAWNDREGQRQEKTEWHNLTMYGKLAEVVGEYVNKGDKIYAEGSLTTRMWEDKKTQEKRYATDIKVRNMEMLNTRKMGDDNAYASKPSARPTAQAPKLAAPPSGKVDQDDLPF